MSSKPIGIFDSGLGGLSVLKQLTLHLPNESIIYIADSDNAPYGNKSPTAIRNHCQNLLPLLAKQPLKLLIIACNTACTIALDLFQTLPYPVLPITEQALLAVQAHPTPDRLAILATQATINSNYYQEKLSHLQLFPTPCPNLAALIEQNLIDHPLTHQATHDYLNPLIPQKPTAILLACTHYPFLSPVISSILPVPLIDPAVTCIQTLRTLITPSTTTPTRTFINCNPHHLL